MSSTEPRRRRENGKSKDLEKGSSCHLREDCLRVLSDQNELLKGKTPGLSKEQLLRMYRAMVFTRKFDERGMMLQRQGRIGFYVPSFGQEAIQIGTAAALGPEDWVFPSYREPGIFHYRGTDPVQMMCNLYGNRGDICKGRQMPVHYSDAKHRMFSVSSPIATQIIQAVGAALASRLQGRNEVAATYCGDGGTSENDFHTGLTFAGVYKAPVLFVVTNNQYAISVPVAKQTGAARIADKAIGYGMPGVAIDGNDILAVYQAASDAVARAREGQGPSLLECVTLRMGPHSSSDDPTRYRDEKQYEFWKNRDPIVRLREFLEKQKYWSAKEEAEYAEEVKSQLEAIVQKAEAQEGFPIEALFEDVYAELTPQLQEQQEALLREEKLRGAFENTSESFPL